MMKEYILETKRYKVIYLGEFMDGDDFIIVLTDI